MKTRNNKTDEDFHAVEFMCQVRAKLSKQYLADKEKYLEYVRKAMSDFKRNFISN